MTLSINGFDFDGVISIGIYPGPNDIIITGRAFDEASYVKGRLKDMGIGERAIFFNPITKELRETGTEKSRRCSGQHKARTIAQLRENGVHLGRFFEDDELQVEEILKLNPEQNVVVVLSDTEK